MHYLGFLWEYMKLQWEAFFFFDKTMRGSVPLYRKQSDQRCLSEFTVVAEALRLTNLAIWEN